MCNSNRLISMPHFLDILCTLVFAFSAFGKAGILLSSLVLCFVCFQSYSTSLFLLETCARAETLESYIEGQPQLKENVIRERKFEVTVLAKMFLGEHWARIYCLTTSFDLYGITWAFCVVFAGTLSELVPIHGAASNGYNLYLVAFVLVSVPLSCVSILDQVFVQLVFLGLRVTMVILMVSTLIIALMRPDKEFFDDFPEGSSRNMTLASVGSTISLIQTCIFGTAFQFAVPGVANICRDRSRVHTFVAIAILFVLFSNLLLAVLASIYFAEETDEFSNVNWLTYNGGSSAGITFLVTRIVSYYIVLMAAVDGLAVYPLNTIPLGEGLMGAFYGTCHRPKDWKTRVAFHLLASVPQAIGAFFVQDLGRIAEFAGIFTVLSYTLFPSLLQLASRRKMLETFEELHRLGTLYEHPIFSSVHLARLFAVLSIVLVIAVITEAITNVRD